MTFYGARQIPASSREETPTQTPTRRVDPLCFAVWSFVPIAVFVFVVGIITIAKWVF